MAQRRHDPEAKWYYPARYPGMDMRMAANAVDPRMLVDAVGVDGRFEGAIRTFPGFGAQSVHGVPAPTAGTTTIESIANIALVKYASIRKGTGKHCLRGLLLFGDNQAGTGRALYFAYKDSETGSSDVVMLEDFRAWDDFRPDTFEDYDMAYLGRYAYFVNSGDIVTTVPSFTDKQAPYNKAYFWDFKVNTWDKYVGGLQGRIAGVLPERCLDAALNSLGEGAVDDSDAAYDTEIMGAASNMPAGEYTYAAELISRKHKLRSYIRWATIRLIDSVSALRWTIARNRLPDDGAGDVNQLKGNSNSLTAPIHWGIGHVDGFRLWRSPLNDTGTVQASNQFETTQHLYLMQEYWEKDLYNADTTAQVWELYNSNDDSFVTNPPTEANVPVRTDDGLLTQTQYDAVFHEVGAMPRLKRLVGFDGMLLGVTDPREPDDPDEKWSDAERLPESFCWSAIHSGETENFPVLNYEELDDPAERVLGLFAGASSAFAVTNMGVYRALRAGTSLSITRIVFPKGCVSRFGACMVGDILYVVTRTGIKEIDGLTGEVRNVRLLNRLVFDDRRWASSLSNIHVGYDGFAGAIVLLNTSLQEAVLLWEATGAVTRLVDCPWSFIASGPDVKTDNGDQRAYLVTTTGKVHTVDAFRESGKATMCGASASETVNGTATSSSATNLVDSTATFPVGCVGFQVYILSGDRAGETATITARNSATDLSISGLSGALASGDRYSIAPVVVTMRFARLSGMGDDDPFVRKLPASIMASLQELQGETGSSDVNAYVRLGLHSGSSVLSANEARISAIPDQTACRANIGSTKLYPYLASYGSNMDYEVDAILVQGHLSVSEAESRQA